MKRFTEHRSAHRQLARAVLIVGLQALFVCSGQAQASAFQQLMAICLDASSSLNERVEQLEALGYQAPDEVARQRQLHAAAIAYLLSSDVPNSELLTRGGALFAKYQPLAQQRLQAYLRGESSASVSTQAVMLSKAGGYEVSLIHQVEQDHRSGTRYSYRGCNISAGLTLGGGAERIRFPANSLILQADFGSLLSAREGDMAISIAMPTLARLGGTLPADWPELGLVAAVRQLRPLRSDRAAAD